MEGGPGQPTGADDTEPGERDARLEQHLEDSEPADIRVLPNPKMPTEAERQEHNTLHIPYRSWCRSCVEGGGKADPHYRRDPDAEPLIPTISVDYCFMGTEKEVDVASKSTIPIIVHRNHLDRHISACPVLRKGAEKHAVEHCAEELQLSGLGHFIYKSDGEPAILSLKQASVEKLRAVAGASIQVEFEESGVGESAGNAIVERAIWEVERLSRTLLFFAEDLHQTKTDEDHPARLWAIVYSGQLLSRAQKGSSDGKTSFELRRGRKFSRQLPWFTEPVLYLVVATKNQRKKYERRWEKAIYVGLDERTNMYRISNSDGVWRCNCIKRVPDNEKSDAELFKSMKGTPWQPRVEDGEREIRARVAVPPLVPEAELPIVPRNRLPEGMPRRLYIRRNVELERYGFSEFCVGCDHARFDLPRAPHTESCRNRIEQAIAQDDRDIAERLRRIQEARGQLQPTTTTTTTTTDVYPNFTVGGSSSSSAALPPPVVTQDQAQEGTVDQDTAGDLPGDDFDIPFDEEGDVEMGLLTISSLTHGVSVEVGKLGGDITKDGLEGLPPGCLLDLSRGWRLQEPRQAYDAQRRRDVEKPAFLLGGGRCDALCCSMYGAQLEDGNHFIHKIEGDSCDSISQLLADPRVFVVNGRGVVTRKNKGRVQEGSWLTSSRVSAFGLSLLQAHEIEHTDAETTLTLARSMRNQLQQDGRLTLGALEPGMTGHNDWTNEELDLFEKFYDDLTGLLLPAGEVKKARAEEIIFLKSFPVYEIVRRELSKGKTFISVRWCDTDKGGKDGVTIRSRLVGREFKWRDPFMEGTFAATPPLESLRLFFSWCMTIRRRNGRRIEIKIAILDVHRAHFHPHAVRETYIELPAEDFHEGCVGRLLRTLYGTRDAAHQFDIFFNACVAAAGWTVGTSSPCIYRHETEIAIGWRHGDDSLFAGESHVVDDITEKLSKEMHMKRRAKLGFGEEDDKHTSILNRLISLEVKGGKRRITYEPDPRHQQLLVRNLGLDDPKAKGTNTPTERTPANSDVRPLEGSQVTAYRSATMRLNYLAQDMPHLQFAANKGAKHMAKPIKGGMARLKRAARFLKRHPRWIIVFTEQEWTDKIQTRVDSDWAGDLIDRKSTTCVHIVIGEHFIKSFVSTQATPALSSGEAEFTATVKGGSVSIGVQSIAADFGETMWIELGTDSSAAKGMISRAGLGKVRHLDTGLLWIQHFVEIGVFKLRKLNGTENSSDLGTKELSEKNMRECLARLSIEEASGSHSHALVVAG